MAAVSESDILGCEMITQTTTLSDLLAEFQDRDKCYTLNEMANNLDISTTNALDTFTKKLEEIALRISSKFQDGSRVCLAGIHNSDDTGPCVENPESAPDRSAKRSEEYIKAFSRVSPLVSSTSVRPDLWLKSSLESDVEVPVLLIEIVSGSENDRSVSQTVLKALCNTVDLMRLYMNIFDSDLKDTEVSSIVLPKDGSEKICSAVQVTVKWGEGLDWWFNVSFTTISIDKVAFECERIASAQYEWLKTRKVNLRCPKYLVRLYDLPATMKQIPTKNSIVIFEKSDSGNRVLKFTPRVQEIHWLNRIRGSQSPDSAAVAAKPRDLIEMRGLSFFTYDAVAPPLARTRLSACFGDFVLETARSLRRLHVDEKLAHLDVHTFNVGYSLSTEQDRTPRSARAVFIDLDRGTAKIDLPVTLRTAGAQCAKPSSWPAGLVLSAKRCDWRQWALMVWSLLARDVDEVRNLYSGRSAESGFGFLDEILTGVKSDWDEMSEAVLLERIREWITSDEVERVKEWRPAFNTTTLADEVRPLADVDWLLYERDREREIQKSGTKFIRLLASTFTDSPPPPPSALPLPPFFFWTVSDALPGPRQQGAYLLNMELDLTIVYARRACRRHTGSY
jgi:hypothetical protein